MQGQNENAGDSQLDPPLELKIAFYRLYRDVGMSFQNKIIKKSLAPTVMPLGVFECFFFPEDIPVGSFSQTLPATFPSGKMVYLLDFFPE